MKKLMIAFLAVVSAASMQAFILEVDNTSKPACKGKRRVGPWCPQTVIIGRALRGFRTVPRGKITKIEMKHPAQQIGVQFNSTGQVGKADKYFTIPENMRGKDITMKIKGGNVTFSLKKK